MRFSRGFMIVGGHLPKLGLRDRVRGQAVAHDREGGEGQAVGGELGGGRQVGLDARQGGVDQFQRAGTCPPSRRRTGRSRAEPRLVMDHTRSSPCTVLTASSMGRVTVTSIWSMGATPLSTPMTTRGKSVSGKTATGMVQRQVDAHSRPGQDDEDDGLAKPAPSSAVCRVRSGNGQCRSFRSLLLGCFTLAPSSRPTPPTTTTCSPAETPLQDLHLVAIADAGLRPFSRAPRNRRRPPSGTRRLPTRAAARPPGPRRTLARWPPRSPPAPLAAGLQPLAGILRLHPDLHGGAAWVRRRADHGDLARRLQRAVGQCDRGGWPTLRNAGLVQRNIDARHHAGDVHHREQGRSGAGHLAGVERPVRNHAVDGAADLRIAELGLGGLIVPLGGVHLRRGALDLLLLARLPWSAFRCSWAVWNWPRACT